MAVVDLSWIEKREYVKKQCTNNLWIYHKRGDKKEYFRLIYNYKKGDGAYVMYNVEYFVNNEQVATAYFDNNLNVIKVVMNGVNYTSDRYTERWKKAFVPFIIFSL